jgi:5-methylcytosine-specific restriction endonuclease McrA
MPPEREILQMPYKGSKAVLRIGNKWITARLRSHVNRARRGPVIREYIQRRHNWSDEQYDNVYWRTIGEVRRKSTLSQQRFTCKLMHGLLPVNHVRQHETQVAQCPNCAQCGDETIAHVFQCTHPEMTAKRAEIIAALRKKGLRKISKQILHVVAELVEQYASGGGVRVPTDHPTIQGALEAQEDLGWDDFFRGYIVSEWLQAFEDTHNGDSHQQFYQFQKIIWYEVALPQWQERNRLAHGSQSHDKRIESAKLAEELVWYSQHKDELPPSFREQWAGHSTDEISSMSLATRRLWLHHIEIARDAYAKRNAQRGEHQSTLSYYFNAFRAPIPPKPPYRRRRDVATQVEATEHAERVVLYREKGQPRIDTFLNKLE